MEGGPARNPQAGPVATGRAGSTPHSDQDPSYSARGGWPSVSRASETMAAVTPEPQVVMTGFAGSTPASAKTARRESASFSRPSAWSAE